MRARSKWFTVHRWLGIGLGVWFALVGLSGAILVFEDPIDAWLNPRLLTTGSHGTQLSAQSDRRACRICVPARTCRKNPISGSRWRGLPVDDARKAAARRRRAYRSDVRSCQRSVSRRAFARITRHCTTRFSAYVVRVPPQRIAWQPRIKHRRYRRAVAADLCDNRFRSRSAAHARGAATDRADQSAHVRHAHRVRLSSVDRHCVRNHAAAGNTDRAPRWFT